MTIFAFSSLSKCFDTFHWITESCVRCEMLSGMEVHVMRFYPDPLPFKTWEHPVDKSGRSHFLCGGILRSLIRGISSDYVGQGKKQSGGS